MQTRDEVESLHNCLLLLNTGKKFSSCLNIAFLEKYCYFVVKFHSAQCTGFTRISAAVLIKFFLQKCGAYLRAVLYTIVIPLSTVFARISTVALINPHPPTPPPPKCGTNLRAALIRVITVTGNLRVYYIYGKLLSHLALYYIQGRLSHLGLLQHLQRNRIQQRIR